VLNGGVEVLEPADVVHDLVAVLIQNELVLRFPMHMWLSLYQLQVGFEAIVVVHSYEFLKVWTTFYVFVLRHCFVPGITNDGKLEVAVERIFSYYFLDVTGKEVL
jgi:hypothetical protein